MLFIQIIKEWLKFNHKKKQKMQRMGHRSEQMPVYMCMYIYVWKAAEHHMSSEIYKLKQLDIITHLLEWLEFKKMTIPNIDKDVEQ